MTPDPSTPSRTTKTSLGQVAGGVAGAAVGIYTGANLLIPGVAGAAIWYFGSKVVRPSQPRYLPAIAVQGAHLAWLAFGMALLGVLGPNLIDVALLATGIAWLWLRPGAWPVLFLTAFQLFALAVNIALILDAPVGSANPRSLALHILLRTLALGAMWYALVRHRREQRGA